DVALAVDQDDAVWGCFYDQPKSVLRLLELGYVNTRADIAEEVTIGGKAWRPAVQDPSVFTVASPQAIFHREGLPSLKGVNINFETTVQVVGVNILCPTVTKFLL